MGYDSLWVCDHLYGPQSPQIPILEAWSLVSAVAAVTSRVEIGTLVTPAGMRNAAQLGKVIATVDNIAEGRIIPGLGAGWMPREFTDFGVDFLPTGQRRRRSRRIPSSAATSLGDVPRPLKSRMSGWFGAGATQAAMDRTNASGSSSRPTGEW